MSDAQPSVQAEIAHPPSSAPALFGLLPWAASAWAVAVVASTLVMAIYRLGVRGLALLRTELDALTWCALIACTALFAYGEGYRALHLRFAPSVIARAASLTLRSPYNPLTWLVGPLHALGLVQRDLAASIRAWVSVALIVLACLVVRMLPEPWRGIIDASVTVALSIGLVSLLLGFVQWSQRARTQTPTL